MGSIGYSREARPIILPIPTQINALPFFEISTPSMSSSEIFPFDLQHQTESLQKSIENL